MNANPASEPVRPGSMGRPVAGVEAALVRRDADGAPVVGPDGGPELVDDPSEQGEIALRAGWPSMFTAYLHDDERYARCFLGDWYLSGDLARRDADGWFWFVGRGNDVIKTAGHLVGPFEIESALLAHPAVAEAAAIGVPDPVAGEIVAAKVVLHAGHEDSPALRRELRGLARAKLGAALAPRAIDVVPDLPHTRSGKIMRRLVRARHLGLPEGDTSTVEPAP
jgi:acetyl-CoA synthetase